MAQLNRYAYRRTNTGIISTHGREKLVHHHLRRQVPGLLLADTMPNSREDFGLNKGPDSTANRDTKHVNTAQRVLRRNGPLSFDKSLGGKHERACKEW